MPQDTSELLPDPEEQNLHDMMSQVSMRAIQFELSAASFLKKGSDKSLEMVNLQINELASTIENALCFVSSSEEYNIEEKAGIMATIIIDDDKRRVTFLNDLCATSGDEPFKVGYPEEEIIATQIQEVIEYSDEPDDIVEKIIDYHTQNMEMDISNLINSPIAVEKVADRARKDKNNARLQHIGETVVATAIGVYLAMSLSNKRHKK